MRARAERAARRPDVRGPRPHREAGLRELVLDAELERERIAGLGIERVLHGDTVRLAVRVVPGGPAHEPVDGVPVLGLCQRELMEPPVELVTSSAHTVRPGNQDLPATRLDGLVRAIAVDELAAADGIGQQPPADLDDDGTLVAEREVELPPGREAERGPDGRSVSSWRRACVITANHGSGSALVSAISPG